MQMQMAKKQQGFTIIELVVVILLLGILAATALPRFMDVTDEAHNAAFEGNISGFATGLALYRAQWVAEGQPAAGTAIAEFDNLLVAPGYTKGAVVGGSFVPGTLSAAAASGYPVGKSAVADVSSMTAARCEEVFKGILQQSVNSSLNANGAAVSPANFESGITGLANASEYDFQVYAVNIKVDTGIADPSANVGDPENYEDTQPACVYVYTAQAGNLDRSVIYVPWTGELERFNAFADLKTRLTSVASAPKS